MKGTHPLDQREHIPENESYESRFSQAYSDETFWDKLEHHATTAGHEVVRAALILYYTLNQNNLPRWVTALSLTALGYFVLPTDAIPDILPVVGFADDLGILVAAAETISNFKTVEITSRTVEKLSSWFPKINHEDES